MKNLKVSAKLVVGFMAVLALAAAVGALGIYGLSRMDAMADEVYHGGLISVDALGNLREIFATQNGDMRNIFLLKDDTSKVQNIISSIQQSDRDAETSFSAYETTILNEADEKAYFTVRDAWRGAYAATKSTMWQQINAGDYDGAYKTFTNGSTVATTIGEGLDAVTLLCENMSASLNERANDLHETLQWTLIAILAVSLGIAFALAFYVSGLISKPLAPLCEFMTQVSQTGDIALRPQDMATIEKYAAIKDEVGQTISAAAAFVARVTEVSKTLEIIADGDLTAQITPLSEKDVLGNSLARMTENLNTMFEEINSSSSQVSVGSHQVADGAQALAAGSTEQAASVEQLSSSIAEVAERTKDNATKAEQASKLAISIKNTAERGSGQMDEMMKSVKDINEASQSISKVIKTIDDIAFQTNILALNAAVEAARAGQHGKGFAVVAEEVRNLAAKSAEAAKDTESLIADSMQKAEQGVHIAGETAASLSDIVSGINQSNALIAEIARASEEQSMSITQINTGIDQVAKVVQQNSATAQQSAAASQEMSSQSAVLQDLIAQFKLGRPLLGSGLGDGGRAF